MTATDPRYRAPRVHEHLIESQIVAQRFVIRVLEPIQRADDSERFPVVYATDSDEFFGGIANIARELQLVGEVPRFVLVAIGYEDERDADILRMRDLFPHRVRHHFLRTVELLLQSPLGTGHHSVDTIMGTTDAGDFLRFIREELMPFIAARHPVVADDNSYYGYSAGGTFGLHTLFEQPDTFRRYILGSPAISYDGDHYGIEFARAFVGTGRGLQANVFMSAGELEEFYGKFDLVTGCYLMAKYLQNAAIPGLDLKFRLFSGESHATAWTLAFSHGLRTLFGPTDKTPWWPDF